MLRSKIRHGQCSKTPKSYVAKGDATLSLDSSATLQNQTQSEKQTHPTLTLGSEIDSEKVSLASLATPSPADSFETEEASGLLANQEEHPKKQNLPRTVDEFWSGDDNYELGYDARELLYMIKPNLTDELVKRDVPVILECLKHVPEDMDAADLIKWNHLHRNHKYASKDDKRLYIRSAQQFLNTLTVGELTLLNDYDQHGFDSCEICQEHCLMHTKTLRELAAEERERKAEAERQRLAAMVEAERQAVEEKAVAEQRAKYVWDRKRNDLDRKAFRFHKEFDAKIIFDTFAPKQAPEAVLNTAVIYFASLGRPFDWEEFEEVFIDIWRVWSAKQPPKWVWNPTTKQTYRVKAANCYDEAP